MSVPPDDKSSFVTNIQYDVQVMTRLDVLLPVLRADAVRKRAKRLKCS